MNSKFILIIIALALSFSPLAANASLVLHSNLAATEEYQSVSNVELPDVYCQAGNWAPVSDLSLSAIPLFERSLIFPTLAIQTTSSYGRLNAVVQPDKKPGQLPASILLFGPSLAVILVGRNRTPIARFCRSRRSFIGRVRQSSPVSILLDHLNRFLRTKGYPTYLQFVHFQLRTIQLNR